MSRDVVLATSGCGPILAESTAYTMLTSPLRVGWCYRLLVACLTTVASACPLGAQTLDHPLTHLMRSHWSALEGLPNTNYTRVVRSSDGYLWLGSTDGLIRFDGARFVTMDSTRAPALRMLPNVSYSLLDESHPLPARMSSIGLTIPLLADVDGTMWVGTPDGRLLRYRDGAFEVVRGSDPKIGRFTAMLRDGAGRLWLQGSIEARLYSFRDGQLLEPDLPPGVPHTGIVRVVADTGRGLWMGVMNDALYHVSGSEVRTFPQPNAGVIPTAYPLLQTADGTLWVQGRTLYRLVGNDWIPALANEPGRVAASTATLLPDGAVVLGTRGTGLLRWKDGAMTSMNERDGLSSESVRDVLLDQEGSLWALTDAGLDRLRASPFITISARNGLPLVAPATLRFQGNGFLWASSGSRTSTVTALDLDRLITGQSAIVGSETNAAAAGFNTPFTALPGGGMLFVSNIGRLVHRKQGRLVPFDLPRAPTTAAAIALTTRDSSVWLGYERGGLGRVADGAFLPIESDDLRDAEVGDLAEGNDGSVWAAPRGRPVLVAIRGDKIVRRLGPNEGLTEPLAAIAVGSGDTLFAAGVSGTLMRITGQGVHRFVSPQAARILRAASPTIIVRPRAVWLTSSAGIASISDSALAADTVVPHVYGALDGLPVAKVGRARFGTVATDRRGRIWISTPAGLAFVDPATLRANEMAARVHIEEVLVAGRRVEQGPDGTIQLPSNPERVEIHFTATALRMPERVRLEYRLDGIDRDWVTSGVTRTASYTSIRPGRYAFHVRAWNEDGVAAANEGLLSLRVLPAWYQTLWATSIGVLVLLGIGSLGAYRWQHARAAEREARLHERFRATLEERTRVAREMHDTLLNGFTGITMQLQGLQDALRGSPEGARAHLERILTRADEALRDARHAIWDMRRSADPDEPLAEALEHSAREAVEGSPIEVQLVVRGSARQLTPVIEDTLRRVGREAVRNAARHAGAQRVQLELAYGSKEVQLIVRDDGRGLDVDAADAARAAGHYGLSGMRERAEAVGGSLAVRGVANEGTTISLSLPVGSG